MCPAAVAELCCWSLVTLFARGGFPFRFSFLSTTSIIPFALLKQTWTATTTYRRASTHAKEKPKDPFFNDHEKKKKTGISTFLRAYPSFHSLKLKFACTTNYLIAERNKQTGYDEDDQEKEKNKKKIAKMTIWKDVVDDADDHDSEMYG